MATSIIESAEMLVGKSEKLVGITLQLSDNFEEFQQRIFAQARQLDEGSGVMILVDLLGGSPYNATAKVLSQENIECLTGLNLSMLLTALDQREYCDLKQLAKECKEAAITNIVGVRENLMIELDEDDE